MSKRPAARGWTWANLPALAVEAPPQSLYAGLMGKPDPAHEIRVASWDELHASLYEGSFKPAIGRYRASCAYRGMDDAGHLLQPSLTHLGAGFERMELHLLRNFRKYAYLHGKHRDSVWYWLSLGQHHGLPTRLFDWTFSPLVALHFATCHLRHFDRDAAVYCVDFVAAHRLAPESLRGLLEGEGSDVFTVEMLETVAASLKEFGRLSEEPFLVFFEPPSLDERIINQYALHSLLSRVEIPLSGWLDEHPGLWRKIVIPAELKWEIRDKLDQANITERVLYPGLDGLTGWLRRQYTTRPQ